MAVKTFYLKNAVPTGATLHRSLQDGGTAPTNAITTTGWVVATRAAGDMCIQNGGTEYSRTGGNWSTTAQPASAPSQTIGDCWRSENTLTGTFANTNWSLVFQVRSVTAAWTGRGRLRVRVWKSSNANGTSATELTSATQTSNTSTANLSTTVSTAFTVTWSPGSTLSFNNEYLFVQVAVEVTTAGSATGQDWDFYVGSAAAITTSDFSNTVTATGASSIGSLTATATATITAVISATASAVFDNLTGNASTVEVTHLVTASSSLGTFNNTASADKVVFATATKAFGSLTASATASATHTTYATGSTSFGTLSSSASATKIVLAVATRIFGGLTANAPGIVFVPAFFYGIFNSTTTATAIRKLFATATKTFGGLTVTAAADRKVSATASSTIGSLTGSTTITVRHPVTATKTFGGVTSNAIITVRHTATANSSLGGLTGSASAQAGPKITYAVLNSAIGSLVATFTASNAPLSPVQISGLSALRLHEIFQRLELESGKPLSVSNTQITVDEIIVNYSATSVARQDRAWSTASITDQMILEIWQRLGLDPDNPITQSDSAITFGGITLNITGTDPITVTRA